jgi:hypothetical protein
MALALTVLGFAVIALAIMGMVIARYAYMYTRAKLGAPDAPAQRPAEDAFRDDVDRLKARVAVLEELATDGDAKLSRDIERLGRQGAATSA